MRRYPPPRRRRGSGEGASRRPQGGLREGPPGPPGQPVLGAYPGRRKPGTARNPSETFFLTGGGRGGTIPLTPEFQGRGARSRERHPGTAVPRALPCPGSEPRGDGGREHARCSVTSYAGALAPRRATRAIARPRRPGQAERAPHTYHHYTGWAGRSQEPPGRRVLGTPGDQDHQRGERILHRS
jgi:hypothetical protein